MKILKQMVMMVGFVFAMAGLVRAEGGAKVPGNEQPAAEAGFVSLFNGRDFSGWHFGTESYALPTEPQKTWKVEGGAIKQAKSFSKPNLFTQWDYEDFELVLEWRITVDKGYNSGVFIRCVRNNQRDNQINLKQGDEGNLVPLKMPGARPCPELLNPVNEWNEWRILAVGEKVTFSCNGKPGWEVNGFKSKSGYIGLQAEYFPFEFRNLRIREMGFDALNDLTKWTGINWKMDDGALSASAGAQNLNLKDEKLHDYHLRLEWRSSKGLPGKVLLRGAKDSESLIPLSSGNPPENPKGEWNYLDVTTAGTSAAIILNGKPMPAVELKTGEGGIGLSPELEYRNIRVKRLASK